MSEVNPNTGSGEVVEKAEGFSIFSSAAAALAQHIASNQPSTKKEAQTGKDEPVAEVVDNNVDNEAEVVEQVDDESVPSTQDVDDDEAPEEVSKSDDTGGDILDFVEFANQTPDAKFKFIVNGKEVIKTAKQAAALLGQSSAIHEKARELKAERSAFEEESEASRKKQTDLLMAMDYVVEPRLAEAHRAININIDNLNQLTELEKQYDPNDYVSLKIINDKKESLIKAINESKGFIDATKPRVDKFREMRREQVEKALTKNRSTFKDPELKNKFNFEQLREKIAKNWELSKEELIPGVPNLDIVSADEQILSLIRDGLRYREKVPSKTAGTSVAQVLKKVNANPKMAATSSKPQTGSLEDLRERAKNGDKQASAKIMALFFQNNKPR